MRNTIIPMAIMTGIVLSGCAGRYYDDDRYYHDRYYHDRYATPDRYYGDRDRYPNYRDHDYRDRYDGDR